MDELNWCDQCNAWGDHGWKNHHDPRYKIEVTCTCALAQFPNPQCPTHWDWTDEQWANRNGSL